MGEAQSCQFPPPAARRVPNAPPRKLLLQPSRFSGCHRYEAHQRLGLETIKCRVRKATKADLMMHLR